ncbi:MAG TPA: hypothetical protein VID30_04620 [Bradyrhizobium sp.]
MTYRHTQPGTLILIGRLLAGALGMALLYNVSGLDAVELRLKSNEVRRIGTDDPQGLAEALRSRRGR